MRIFSIVYNVFKAQIVKNNAKIKLHVTFLLCGEKGLHLKIMNSSEQCKANK
jgi:hypothetical protein